MNQFNSQFTHSLNKFTSTQIQRYIYTFQLKYSKRFQFYRYNFNALIVTALGQQPLAQTWKKASPSEIRTMQGKRTVFSAHSCWCALIVLTCNIPSPWWCATHSHLAVGNIRYTVTLVTCKVHLYDTQCSNLIWYLWCLIMLYYPPISWAIQGCHFRFLFVLLYVVAVATAVIG